MTRWFRFYSEALDDPKVQRLDGETFKAEMLRALAGKPSHFDGFVVGPFVRPPSHEWAIIRAEVFERDDYSCQYCGAHGVSLECDHIVPVAHGGTHDLENLTTACKPCNRSKAAKSLEDWKR